MRSLLIICGSQATATGLTGFTRKIIKGVNSTPHIEKGWELERRGPLSWSWRAAGCAGVLSPGPGEPQGVLGNSLLVLESRRMCWGPHSWSWRAAGCAGVLTPGPGELQGVVRTRSEDPSTPCSSPGPGEDPSTPCSSPGQGEDPSTPCSSPGPGEDPSTPCGSPGSDMRITALT